MLPQQISALEEWLSANETGLDPAFTWVADVGFVARPDAAGGGPVLTREFMERCVRAKLEIWLSEYRDGDAGRYGKVVNALLGHECSATLATNSIKLAFGHRQKGCPYIWIDPPWRLEHEGRCVTSSSDYAEDAFKAWSRLLDPLRPATLSAWGDEEGTTIFSFAGGQRLVVPPYVRDMGDESWYVHWYATPGRRSWSSGKKVGPLEADGTSAPETAGGEPNPLSSGEPAARSPCGSATLTETAAEQVAALSWGDVTLRGIRWRAEDAGMDLLIERPGERESWLRFSWVAEVRSTLSFADGPPLTWEADFERLPGGGWRVRLDFASRGAFELTCDDVTLVRTPG